MSAGAERSPKPLRKTRGVLASLNCAECARGSASAAAAAAAGKHGGKKKTLKARKRARERLTLEDSIVDPISLEPIRDLEYPPFEVVSEHTKTGGGPGSGRVVHYFDGQFLAHYVVSTANFINPVNRDQLDRDVCMRLDAYLRENNLPSAQVTECYRLFEASSAKQQGEESAHARQLRQEATAVMAALFRTRSNTAQNSNGEGRAGEVAAGGRRAKNRNKNKKTNPKGNSGRGPSAQDSSYVYERRAQGRGGGLVMVDDDDWETPEAYNLSEEQDFPSFAGAQADAAAADAAAPQHLHPSERKGAKKSNRGNGKEPSPASSPVGDSVPQWRAVAGAGSLPYMGSSAEFPSLPPSKRKISRLPGKTSTSAGRWSNLHGDSPSLGPAFTKSGITDHASAGFSSGDKSVSRMDNLASRLAARADEPAPARPARLALRLKKRSVDAAGSAGAPETIMPLKNARVALRWQHQNPTLLFSVRQQQKSALLPRRLHK